MTDPRPLTDDALIRKIDALAAASRETSADLINHLVELERRNLHVACGFKSLFVYCRRVLRCSESASYDRMRAAHAARRFPIIVPMLAEGLLHLTAVRLLWPYLKDMDEDHLALLGGAIHQSTREVKKLIARWFPRADVAASVRKVPERRPQLPATAAGPTAADRGLSSAAGPVPVATAPSPVANDTQPSAAQPSVWQSSVPRPPSRGTVSPL